MNQVKKIEKRLSKLRRLQKQLEKKRKKFNRKLSIRKKQQSRAVKVAAKKAAAAKKVAKAQNVTPETAKSIAAKAVLGAIVGTVCGVVATMAVKALKNKIAEQKALANAEAVAGDLQESQAEYDKASLEELEDALLRVENELDEVSAAIERSKK